LATGQKSLAYMGAKIWEPLYLRVQPFYAFN